MTILSSSSDIDKVERGGALLSEMFFLLGEKVREGVSTMDIEEFARSLCDRFKVRPAFLGYKGYPYATCANVNSVIVHGFPGDYRLKNGDILGLDFGIVFEGFFLDMSYTFPVGQVKNEVLEFVDKTKKSLIQGVQAARVGNTVGDISYALRKGLIDRNFTLSRDFVGHGIGGNLHESPEIPGIGMDKKQGEKLRYGQLLAIESISIMGNDDEYVILEDNWTVVSKHNFLSALFEVTLMVDYFGGRVFTKFDL